jgi:hypothetical protein
MPRTSKTQATPADVRKLKRLIAELIMQLPEAERAAWFALLKVKG